MTTVRVTLSDAATDVLMHLASLPGTAYTTDEIALAVALTDVTTPRATTMHSLQLLRTMGYVERLADTRWIVTDDGGAAIPTCRCCGARVTDWPSRDCEEPEEHTGAIYDCDCGDAVTMADALAHPSKHRRCNLIGSRP